MNNLIETTTVEKNVKQVETSEIHEKRKKPKWREREKSAAFSLSRVDNFGVCKSECNKAENSLIFAQMKSLHRSHVFLYCESKMICVENSTQAIYEKLKRSERRKKILSIFVAKARERRKRKGKKILYIELFS